VGAGSTAPPSSARAIAPTSDSALWSSLATDYFPGWGTR